MVCACSPTYIHNVLPRSSPPVSLKIKSCTWAPNSKFGWEEKLCRSWKRMEGPRRPPAQFPRLSLARTRQASLVSAVPTSAFQSPGRAGQWKFATMRTPLGAVLAEDLSTVSAPSDMAMGEHVFTGVAYSGLQGKALLNSQFPISGELRAVIPKEASNRTLPHHWGIYRSAWLLVQRLVLPLERPCCPHSTLETH